MDYIEKYIDFEKFGKTVQVKARIVNSKNGEYDKTLWVERPEDEYALMSPDYSNCAVAVVLRDNFIKAIKK